MTPPPEVLPLLSLNLVPGLGPRLTAALLERFGSAAAIFQASPDQLAEVPHIGKNLARDLHQAMRTIDVTRELELVNRFKVSLLALGSDSYPASLAEVCDPP